MDRACCPNRFRFVVLTSSLMVPLLVLPVGVQGQASADVDLQGIMLGLHKEPDAPHQLVRHDIEGGRVVRRTVLADDLGRRSASGISPDGRRVAVMGPRDDRHWIGVMLSDGGEVRWLAEVQGEDLNFRRLLWSTAGGGQWVYCISHPYDDGPADLWRVHAGTGRQERVVRFNGSIADRAASRDLSPTTGRLFARNSAGGSEHNLYEMAAGDGDLTREPLGDDCGNGTTPDGRLGVRNNTTCGATPPLHCRGKAPVTVALRAPDDQAGWQWRFGDGHRATGAWVEHHYETPGRYEARARRGDHRMPFVVTVRPPQAPKLTDQVVVIDHRRVRLTFDERVDLGAATLLADGEAGDAGALDLGDSRRTLLVALPEPMGTSLTLVRPGVRDVAQQPNEMPETPLENIRAFYEETYRYGRALHAGRAAAPL